MSLVPGSYQIVVTQTKSISPIQTYHFTDLTVKQSMCQSRPPTFCHGC